MNTRTIKLNKILFYFFALLIVYLPFQRILEQILLNRGFSESLAFWSTHWYEPVIIIILLLNCLIAIRSKCPFCHPEEPRATKDLKGIRFFTPFRMTILVAITLITLSIISIFILSPTISRGIEGFRFAIFFLLAFLAAYFAGLDQKQSVKLTNIYLIMAAVFALWAIGEQFLPANYLESFGLISAGSNFGYGTHKVVTVLQSVSGIGGPNQLASYLLPAVFMSLYKILPVSAEARAEVGNIKNKKYYYGILIFVCILAIILTFSRSAWVGLYVGIFISAIILIKNSWLKIISISILLILAGGICYYYLNKPNDILTHGASDTGHKSALNTSLNEIQNRFNQPATLLLGSGIGTAGPAALKYGDGFISESWYLQLMLELGLAGLVLWLIFVYYLLVLFYKKNQGLFSALIAVSVTAIFLHTFADNPAMSMTLFLLIGISINLKPKDQMPNEVQVTK